LPKTRCVPFRVFYTSRASAASARFSQELNVSNGTSHACKAVPCSRSTKCFTALSTSVLVDNGATYCLLALTTHSREVLCHGPRCGHEYNLQKFLGYNRSLECTSNMNAAGIEGIAATGGCHTLLTAILAEDATSRCCVLPV